MVTIRKCPECGGSVYWLVDSETWRHYTTRNLDCDVVLSVLLGVTRLPDNSQMLNLDAVPQLNNN